MVEAAKRRVDVLEHILLSGPPGSGKPRSPTSSPTPWASISRTRAGRSLKKRATWRASNQSGKATSCSSTKSTGCNRPSKNTSCDGRLPARYYHRSGTAGAQSPPATAKVHAGRRDHARRHGQRAIAVAVRDDARLDYYTADEMQKIILRSAGLLGVEIDHAGAAEIARARAAHHAPRTICCAGCAITRR